MWLTKISVKNPYLATVLMLMLLLLGLIALKNISIDEFPNIKFPIAVISTTYTGASPEVVETDISKPLEEALNTLNGMKTIRSYSFEGLSIVVAEFNLNVNPDTAINDVRDKVSEVASNFKKEVDTPLISRVDNREQPLISLIIASKTLDLKDLTLWSNQTAKKELQTVAGVGEVKLIGGTNRQVRINIEPYKLQSLGIAINDVVNSIARANNNYPSGYIQTQDEKINVRLNGRLSKPSDFANIVITYRNNTPIKVSDIAEVTDGAEEISSLTTLGSKRAVGLDIRPIDNANVVDVANGILTKIQELDKIKPSGVYIKVSYDQSESIKRSLKDIEATLLEGALLTILIVFLFLKSWRSTIITGLTLPISLIGTIFAIWVCGFTLNMMTLMALSLSIGLLIDDAIVVRENIVRHLQMGKSHYQAALDGTNEIGLAVLSTTLTIVAVFLPVGLMQGIIGKFFMQFGLSVTVAVLISLLVSFTLDPMLSSIWHEPKNGGWLLKTRLGKFLEWFNVKFERLSSNYEKLIRLALSYRKTSIIIALLLLVGSFLLIPLIGAEFLPQVDKGKYVLNFKTAIGSNIYYTEDKLNQVSDILKASIPEIKLISGGVNKNFAEGANDATLTIDIGGKSTRNKSLNQIINETRDIMSHIAGIEIQNIMPLGGAGGVQKPISVDIRGENPEILTQIANDLLIKIKDIPETLDVQSTLQIKDPSYNITLNRDLAANLGIDLFNVGDSLGVLFAGRKITTWQDLRTNENYDVVAQIPENIRGANLLDMLKFPSSKDINSNQPNMIPLSTIATINKESALREIDHINLKRNITISGNISGSNNQKVFSQIQSLINNYQLPPGYSITQSGTSQDMNESFGYAINALLVGVIFIYMILTAQFRSFIQPLIIMLAQPLSFIGVFIALFLMGSTLNMFSVIGIIMLMGLATKNGILLVDFINQELRNGTLLMDAIISAGKTRLRPIIMTSLAMIFGMLPLALSLGEGAEMRKPMAYAIIGGMVSSTLLTLIIVPVIYSLIYYRKKQKPFTKAN